MLYNELFEIINDLMIAHNFCFLIFRFNIIILLQFNLNQKYYYIFQ